jgi:outer membrane cobalamin receptor
MKKALLLIFAMFLQLSVFSQTAPQRASGKITGKVIDGTAKEPIEYANIIVYSSDDSSQVTGTVSNKDGIFEISPLKPGNYYVDVQFISYQKKRIENISLARSRMEADLGTIEINATAISLGNVVVEGQRSSISYQIDKKIIDVEQMNTALSGNAADVLQNVPSVTVDIEGNVSLRGSSSFTVLIDGRPSVLDAQDVLQQIPASQIDDIEIITNPSAKYDPEGSAGIINIILKKSLMSGISGITNLNAGLDDKYGGDFIFEYKTNSVSTNIGVDYNNRFFPGESYSENTSTYNGVTSYLNNNGTGTWGRKMLGVRGGIDFYLSQNDNLSFGGRFGRRQMDRESNLSYESWSDVNTDHSFYLNSSTHERSGNFFGLFLNYQHKFEQQGHVLSAEFSTRHNDSEEETLTESFSADIINEGIKSKENGPSNDLEGKIDYTLPLGGNSKFEAGWQGESDISDDNTEYYAFDINQNGYVFNPQYSHKVKSDEREHALYSIYAGEIGNFGYQGGLRAEYTYRSIKVDDNNEFKIDTWDYFPTLHTSYSFSETDQLMASYTRRIQRPRGWSLEPFETWADANNVRRGNPALKSEYIDSYEGGFRTLLGPVSVSTELYYRVTNNKIEEISSVYAENVTLTTFDNVGKDYSLGTELMFNFGLDKIWEVNLMGNLYNYKIEGTLYDKSFSRESFNWSARFNNNIRLASGTQFQVNTSYNSPSVSSQGRREGFFTTDVAVKQELFDRTLSATLQLQDIFASGKNEFASSGPDFSNYRSFKRDSPVVMFNVRYSINNYKSEERRRNNEGDFEGEGGEF